MRWPSIAKGSRVTPAPAAMQRHAIASCDGVKATVPTGSAVPIGEFGVRINVPLPAFAVVVIVIALVWMRSATIITIFYPDDPEPALEELLTFFAIGTGAGAFFAGLVFGISAFSLPMMVDRNVDAITAGLTSLAAVLNNTAVAVFWGFLIVMLVTLGFATCFLGLILVLPLIGYATWHGYRDTIVATPPPSPR